jgi:hypothetical protein
MNFLPIEITQKSGINLLATSIVLVLVFEIPLYLTLTFDLNVQDFLKV